LDKGHKKAVLEGRGLYPGFPVKIIICREKSDWL